MRKHRCVAIGLWMICQVWWGIGITKQLRAEGASEAPGFLTQVTWATVKITNPGSTASGFLVELPTGQWMLVSAAHVFSTMKGEECTIILHRRGEDGRIATYPQTVAIRRENKDLWKKHPTADVAALKIDVQHDANLGVLPYDCLATEEVLKKLPLEPGLIVRALGFPHANIFKGNPEEFGIARLGCIASYPLFPTKENPHFLVDMNTFEGDSGGPVFALAGRNGESRDAGGLSSGYVIGLVSGQHFVDEEFKLIYQSGKFRHRMGLAIIVPSVFIRETIDRLMALTGNSGP
ncbi:serine protease [Thermogutta sp.]|uniref:S1 family peptidase n=1 Tax=Thermogutta sp. TaxID=1962930 RepID=UPI0032208F81